MSQWVPLLVMALAGSAAAGQPLYLVRHGQPVACVCYGREDQPAAERIQSRIREWTGAILPIQAAASDRIPAAKLLIIIGSPASNPVLREALKNRDLERELGEEGLLIRAGEIEGERELLLAGATRLGAIFATGEFLNWRLQIDHQDAWVEPLDLTMRPALPKRMMWSSVGGANWNPDFEQFHAHQSPTALAIAIADEKSYLEHTHWLVDFLSEHKFNGLIFWGFAGSATGGIEPARKMSHYARANGIRVLPLIGTGIYGGFYHGDHPFNVSTFAKAHPAARCQKMDGTPYEDSIAPCSSDSTRFFHDGAEWLFTTFPEIGGVNLENGDWMSCWNPDCAAAKERPENDPNFYWDMMASQREIIDVGLKHQPDAWMTFATYTPFTEQLIRRDLAKAMEQKLAKAVVYPPRFLDAVDPRSIAQWTVSGMHGPTLWPDDAKLPPGRLRHHVAFTHTNSFYGQKYDPDRWWAEPNATYDESSPVLFYQIPHAIRTGFEGFVIKGFVGDVSPANELFYLAAEDLLWDPTSTPELFLTRKLSKAYGGVERARKFVDLLHKTTKDASLIRADCASARQESQTTAGDPRVARRWRNLASELDRRARLAEKAPPSSK